MTIFVRDKLELFELALSSIEAQEKMNCKVNIYLCCDGELTYEQDVWLSNNSYRFYRIHKNLRNLGLAKSLNRLISILGDEVFVFRMDGDDISHPFRFSRQINWMRQNPRVALLGCQAWDIDENSNIIGIRDFPTNYEALRKTLVAVNPVLHPTYCIRRSIFGDPRVRYPEAYLTEDLAFIITLVGYGYIVENIPERLFFWRVSKNFFARRGSIRRAYTEFKWYMRAVKMLYGCFSFQLVFPFTRMALRMLPLGLSRLVYRSGMREIIARTKRKSF